MTGYWLCVTNEENWEIIKREKTWGVSEKNLKLLSRTDVGDLLIFYVKPKKLAGIFKIASSPFKSEEKLFASDEPCGETYPHRVKIEPEVIPSQPKDFEAVVASSLRFGGGSGLWRNMIRRAMQRLSSYHYEDFRKALET